ncbi:hypothetical protein C0J52_03667 [Blattella germanica]|nr:hypothetical protein C0J52_03667 [Blattella germanica]
MFTLLRKIGSYIFASREDDEDDSSLDIDSVLASIEAEEARNKSIESDQVLSPSTGTTNASCQERMGTVTALHTNHGLIDEKFYFDLRDAPAENLRVGARVYYLAFRERENCDWRVRKIHSIIEEIWESDIGDLQEKDNLDHFENFKIENKGAIERKIVGKVIDRDGREVFVHPGNIRFNLDEVSAEFTPIQGDWLELTALVEINKDVCDLGGEVLEIKKFAALRYRIITDIVSYWSPSGYGRVGKDVFFSKDSCEPGYIPFVDDYVVVQAIESDQGIQTWRALSVVPSLQKEHLKKINNENRSINRVNEELDLLLLDKNGITVSNDTDFGSLKFGEEKEIVVKVKNNGPQKQLLFRGKFHCSRSQSQVILQSPDSEKQIVIHPLQTVEFHFKCKGRFIGCSSELFVFTFKGFKIGRYLQLEVREPTQDSLSSNANNRKVIDRKVISQRVLDGLKNAVVISGQRPVKPPAFVPVRIGSFPVPNRIWEAVVGDSEKIKNVDDAEMDLLEAAPCLMSDLNISNYCDKFHMLLYLEEIESTLNMRAYDLERTYFRLAGDFLALAVPGLAERRPSLLIDVQFEGFIHKVLSSEVWIKFNSSFHSSYDGSEYNVSFHASRTTMRRCHAAVNLSITHLGPPMLFPTVVKKQPPQIDIEEIFEKNENNLKSDAEAEATIIKISSQTCRHSFDNCCSTTSLQSFSEKTPPRLPVVTRLFGRTPSNEVNDGSSANRNKCFNNSQRNSDCRQDKLDLGTKTDISKEELQNEVVSNFRKRKLKWFNNRLNRYQKRAVLNILKGEARPLPYVIFGPPGTGKTVTMVEAILQILTLLPDSRLMVATPSNSSANLIAERLLNSGILIPGDLVRLVGFHCLAEGTIPERLIPYCTTGNIKLTRGDDSNPVPVGEPLQSSSNAQTLGRHRITVGTCSALGQLYVMGFTRGHFSHIFVDEAGQATEPEIMIPLNFIHTSCGQAILAGDPMQLGPVIMSRFAKNFGLAESYLVRLLNHFPYQRDIQGFPDSDGYNPYFVTKLAMNYRTVPEILHLPNELFYNSYLQPQVSQSVGPAADMLALLANELPPRSKENGGPPAFVFHGIRGENCQEAGSPSWYNPQEILQAMYYVHKLRNILEDFDIPLPKIGTVEEFQGQERNVIIMSAVRSNPQLMQSDVKHSLGFIGSPKRLNVAITRARVLLIVLGNPHLLIHDPYWKNILDFCVKQDAYTGCDLPSAYSILLDNKNVDSLDGE